MQIYQKKLIVIINKVLSEDGTWMLYVQEALFFFPNHTVVKEFKICNRLSSKVVKSHTDYLFNVRNL